MQRTSRHAKMIQTLSKIAEDVPIAGRARIAAAIVHKNEIISIGTNQSKSHPLQAKFSRHYQAIHIHAEIDAIARAIKRIDAKRLGQSTLYVSRVKLDRTGGNWMWGLAKPCSGCARAIASFDIKNVVWTLDAAYGDNEFMSEV